MSSTTTGIATGRPIFRPELVAGLATVSGAVVDPAGRGAEVVAIVKMLEFELPRVDVDVLTLETEVIERVENVVEDVDDVVELGFPIVAAARRKVA